MISTSKIKLRWEQRVCVYGGRQAEENNIMFGKELIIEQRPERGERPFQAEGTASGKPSGCSILRVLMDSMEASVAGAEWAWWSVEDDIQGNRGQNLKATVVFYPQEPLECFWEESDMI